eukprot:CAMPEP_0176282550 /NCGR_PEP_ID=MMETSP0121_2-20121125/50863_1 /TAXON_ID=160619 /ORGANISM="Kryptoperidinium foliaceum, Strain CCMP 1326" /LENGTH=42 /DNA_ID= /DNA_START= /DNA_END= /DNA_ORIENTATION=
MYCARAAREALSNLTFTIEPGRLMPLAGRWLNSAPRERMRVS